jgi:hypothetical protein
VFAETASSITWPLLAIGSLADDLRQLRHAPRNVTVTPFCSSALSVAASVFLVMELDRPFGRLIQVSERTAALRARASRAVARRLSARPASHPIHQSVSKSSGPGRASGDPWSERPVVELDPQRSRAAHARRLESGERATSAVDLRSE